MSLIVRRINRPKWDESDIDISADAITNCLRTTNNELSVWNIDSQAEIDKAVLALITGSKQTKLSTLHVVIIKKTDAISKKLVLIDSLGDTVVDSLKSIHSDITELKYVSLGIVKDLIIESLKKENYAMYTRAKLKVIMQKALNENLLSLEQLNPDLVKAEKLVK